MRLDSQRTVAACRAVTFKLFPAIFVKHLYFQPTSSSVNEQIPKRPIDIDIYILYIHKTFVRMTRYGHEKVGRMLLPWLQ